MTWLVDVTSFILSPAGGLGGGEGSEYCKRGTPHSVRRQRGSRDRPLASGGRRSWAFLRESGDSRQRVLLVLELLVIQLLIQATILTELSMHCSWGKIWRGTWGYTLRPQGSALEERNEWAAAASVTEEKETKQKFLLGTEKTPVTLPCTEQTSRTGWSRHPSGPPANSGALIK